ncbi:ribbon-helix-helix protein, CopG family [Bradyrhizobium elkanii]|uniref:ribbon-helix-helix protein, CopG family n=1 Tax=Bradyrhizobium elkanii TaxID=29448 RepID=UPI003518E5BE
MSIKESYEQQVTAIEEEALAAASAELRQTTIHLTATAFEALDRLKRLEGVRSRGDVVERAILLLDRVRHHQAKAKEAGS